MKTITVDRGTMDDFTKRINQLNLRATKLNVPPIEWREVSSRVQTWTDDGGKRWAVEVVSVEVSEHPVTLGDWEFVAVSEKIGEDSIVRTFADVDLSSFRGRDDCEHCGKNIRRKHLIVVRNTATGEMKLVGRSCAQDYVGHADAESVALLLKARYDSIGEYDDRDPEETARRGGTSGWVMEDVVALSRSAIRLFGWVSRSEAHEDPSKTSTADILSSPVNYDCQKAQRETTAEDHAEAKKAVEWAAGLPETSGDYLNNLRVLAKLGMCAPRHLGLAVSLIRAYERDLAQKADALRQATGSTSGHVGVVGGRIEKELKAVEFRTMGPDPYSNATKVLIKFVDDAGNVYVWWTTDGTEAYSQLDNDKAVIVRATVKQHSEFRGEKQTTLARVVVK